MDAAWSRGWVRWLAGFLFGVILGYSLFVVGVVTIVFTLIAVIVAIVRRWSLALVSGWITGLGAFWLFIMLRVRWYCSADPTCVTSGGTEFWTWVGVGLIAVGTMVGLWAWRRGRQPASV